MKTETITNHPNGSDNAHDGAGNGQHQQEHEIHFWLDGEPESTNQKEWTPNKIIEDFGKKDPATHYLVQIHGNVSYKDKGNTPIEIHDGEKFQIVSTGPTPVSDGGHVNGAPAFIAGLQVLGYSPTALEGHADHVVFDYDVRDGRFADRKVRLGFVIPGDFPLSPPSGPHISPPIHPTQGGGVHPTGGIGDSPTFTAATKQAWQYWSRPVQNWLTSKKTVGEYMGHIRRLWDTQ